jgi:hypothetical protein
VVKEVGKNLKDWWDRRITLSYINWNSRHGKYKKYRLLRPHGIDSSRTQTTFRRNMLPPSSWYPLGCDAIQSGRKLSMFRRDLLPQSSVIQISSGIWHLGIWQEVASIMEALLHWTQRQPFLWNIDNVFCPKNGGKSAF